MMHLMRYRPEFGLRRMVDAFDRLFQETLPVSYSNLGLLNEPKFPLIDIVDKGVLFEVHAEIPGYTQEELDITVEGDLLTLKGEKKEKKEEVKESFYCKEILHDSFTRTVSLGEEIKKDGIKALMKDGILTVELPKVEARKIEKVKIEIG